VMERKNVFYRSFILLLIISLGIIPALTGISLAEEREIPESFKHLFSCNETITLNEIVEINNQLEDSNDILISGNVNFEDGKAVNLGISKGYPAIMWVYQENPFPTDYDMVMTDGVHILQDDSFVFSIPVDKLDEGKFVAYIFYGIPKESMQNSMMTGKIEFFNGISEEEFKDQKYELMNRILGVDDIKRLQLESIEKSQSIKLQNMCYN